MALGSTQPQTEMSTRKLSGGKGRPALPFIGVTFMFTDIGYEEI
jgi:hypothetical protein